MTTHYTLLEEVNDITECPVCIEMMVDPKMLPCIHTFCLKCLNLHWKDKQPGDRVPCPVCRKEFEIPKGGIGSLQSNFSIQKLIDAQRKLSKDETVICDICLCRDLETVAIKLCVECQQNFCEQCSEVHVFMSSSKSHHLISCGNQSELKKHLKFSGAHQCHKHDGKRLEIYCMDCKVAVCTVCFFKEHKNHDGSDMMEFVEEQANQITEDVDAIGKLSVEVDRQIETLESSLKEFPNIVADTKRVIMEKAEELKRMVDDHVKVLLQKLNLLLSENMENLTTAMKELQSQKSSLDSYATYVGKVIKTASPSYFASVAHDFNSRAAELKTLKNANTEICSEITLIPFDLLDFATAWKNLIGKIDIRGNKFLSQHVANQPTYSGDPELIDAIQFREAVQGEVIVGQELYIVTAKSAHVKVYDVDTFGFKTKFSVKRLTNPKAITAYDQSLFISNFEDCSIYRVDMPDMSVSSWKVGHHASNIRLAMTKQGNVLVTVMESNKICEYTTSGTFVRAIPLDPTMYGPRHAIHLDGDRFLFSHATEGGWHRVCIIDNSGTLIKYYGEHAGSGMGQLNGPRQLAVNRTGFVFVTCVNSGKVVLLDSNLNFVKDIIPTSADLKNPYTVCLDEYRRNLYVSNYENCILSKLKLN